jgi:hypothetical protein
MNDYNVAAYSEDALPQAISPEGAKIANSYLANACSVTATSHQLGIPTHEISAVLHEPLIKSYVNGILRETGYQHMAKLAQKLDDLIDLKWEEIEEAEIGSNKDIADLINMAHKMRLDMSKLLQADTPTGPSNQKNTQVNVFGDGSYGKLMQHLFKDN